MKRPLPFFVLLAGLFVAGTPASAKVFFRIESPQMPAAAKTGISDLVLPCIPENSGLITQLRANGYQVWLQCEVKNLAEAIGEADRVGAAGVIIAGAANSNQISSVEEIRQYMAAHKKLAFRILIAGGKQPRMRGRLVVERDGVLQVSSPSTQPWLDTNLAVVRLAQGIYPALAPVAYDFRWNAGEAPPGAWKPDAEDYALAIAESEALQSDVVIEFPLTLQKALAADDVSAWSMWKKVKPYLEFASKAEMRKGQPVAGIGVIADDMQSSYEPINLMARHNLAFEVVRSADLTPIRLRTWNSLVVFSSIGSEGNAAVRDFATKGGAAILVNLHDDSQWHSTEPIRKDTHSVTYAVGSGEITELGEPVLDPEAFARDIRRWIGRERSTIALWNSLTTLVTGYRQQGSAAATLYLVNYSDQPDNVQVQVKGSFSWVRWESPESPCCTSLPFVTRNGFTEFTIPSLRISGRVHLDSKKSSVKR